MEALVWIQNIADDVAVGSIRMTSLELIADSSLIVSSVVSITIDGPGHHSTKLSFSHSPGCIQCGLKKTVLNYYQTPDNFVFGYVHSFGNAGAIGSLAVGHIIKVIYSMLYDVGEGFW